MIEANSRSINISAIIEQQRAVQPSSELISTTVVNLTVDKLSEYMKFLQTVHGLRISEDDCRAVFQMLGIKNVEFIERYLNQITPTNLTALEKLIRAKPDQLVDAYLQLIVPDKMVNDYVLTKAIKINRKLEGKYKNALEMIQLAVNLNNLEFTSESLDVFFDMEEKYYRTNEPGVDAPTFFKLVIPILNRVSRKKGLEAFYEAREKVILELGKHGMTPEQLSIEILDRRSKSRGRPNVEDTAIQTDFF